jgi:hypothetical protein
MATHIQGLLDAPMGGSLIVEVSGLEDAFLIRQWAEQNRTALDANWANIRAGKPLNRIPPLE